MGIIVDLDNKFAVLLLKILNGTTCTFKNFFTMLSLVMILLSGIISPPLVKQIEHLA